jgi:hypothetical protein
VAAVDRRGVRTDGVRHGVGARSGAPSTMIDEEDME